NDYAIVDDAIMTPYDALTTPVDLTAAGIQVVRGTPSVDSAGTRTATVLFAPGTTATMTLANGSTQPLSTFHVRATEFTVGPEGPASMPAQLPPSSGYT